MRKFHEFLAGEFFPPVLLQSYFLYFFVNTGKLAFLVFIVLTALMFVSRIKSHIKHKEWMETH